MGKKYDCSITILTKQQTQMTTWKDYIDTTLSVALDKALGSIFKDEKLIKVKIAEKDITYYDHGMCE
jgi:hypothetical protein